MLEVIQIFTPNYVTDLAESVALMLAVAGVGYGILWFFTDRSL